MPIHTNSHLLFISPIYILQYSPVTVFISEKQIDGNERMMTVRRSRGIIETFFISPHKIMQFYNGLYGILEGSTSISYPLDFKRLSTVKSDNFMCGVGPTMILLIGK